MVRPGRQRAIAVAQTCPVRGDVGANVAAHLRLTALAAAEGARLVVFPELSLTGYELDLAGELAFSAHDARLSPLVAAARTHAATLIVGAPVRLGSRLHIGAFIVSPDGTVALYTKHHLGAFGPGASRDGTVPPAEATVFEPGDRDPLVRIAPDSAALAICSDTARPAHPRQAAERGAQLYLASMFVIRSEWAAEAARLREYALQHGLMVACANFGGASGGLAAAGRSTIWSSAGDVIVQLGATGEGVAVASESDDGWGGRQRTPSLQSPHADEEPVRIVPYDAVWPARFAAERALLEPALGAWLAGAIEHIGSTAVPGLAAKPIIDIMAPVRDLESSLAARPALAALGYTYFPYRPDVMHWFCKPSPQQRTHHLHLVPIASQLWSERLAFRDLLRRSPHAATEYAELKIDLAARYRFDREAYTEAKSGFVRSLLARPVL